MMKSELYRLAQVAVMDLGIINHKDRLEILRELMSQEDLAKFVEEQESKNEAV